MLPAIGYIFVGAALREMFFPDESAVVVTKEVGSVNTKSDGEVKRPLIKGGKEEVILPPCEIMAVELECSDSAVTKATLLINEKEFKIDFGKGEKYVNLSSFTKYYDTTTNVILKMKKHTETITITAYYYEA